MNNLLRADVIKEIVDDWIGQVEASYGEEAALYYRAGLLDGVELLKHLSSLYQSELMEENIININRAFSSVLSNKKTTGGIN